MQCFDAYMFIEAGKMQICQSRVIINLIYPKHMYIWVLFRKGAILPPIDQENMKQKQWATLKEIGYLTVKKVLSPTKTRWQISSKENQHFRPGTSSLFPLYNIRNVP